MKKNLQTIIIMLLLLGSQTIAPAQNIISISKTPINPTSNDSIMFLADCMFQSGNCPVFNQGVSPAGNNFYAYAMHCLGALSFICNHTDTFMLPPLTAGNYNFIFHLESGMGPNCTPGIVAGPTDTVAFVVTAATGIDEVTFTSTFNIIPNPSNGNLTIDVDWYSKKENCFIEILNLSGATIQKISITDKTTKLNIDLPSGIYLCRLSSNPSAVKKLVIVK